MTEWICMYIFNYFINLLKKRKKVFMRNWLYSLGLSPSKCICKELIALLKSARFKNFTGVSSFHMINDKKFVWSLLFLQFLVINLSNVASIILSHFRPWGSFVWIIFSNSIKYYCYSLAVSIKNAFTIF